MPTTLLVGQIADVHAPDDRRHVVLAMRLERDVAQHDHLVVAADFLERAAQILGRIDLVAREPVAVGVDDALGRVEQALALGSSPAQRSSSAHGLLCLRSTDLRSISTGH